jgi:hypothetical protein
MSKLRVNAAAGSHEPVLRTLSQQITPRKGREMLAVRAKWIEEVLAGGARIYATKMTTFPLVLAKHLAQASEAHVPAHVAVSGVADMLRGAVLRFREAAEAIVEESLRERREAVTSALAKAAEGAGTVGKAGRVLPEVKASGKAAKKGAAAAVDKRTVKTRAEISGRVGVEKSMPTGPVSTTATAIDGASAAAVPDPSRKRVTFEDKPTYFIVESRKRGRAESSSNEEVVRKAETPAVILSQGTISTSEVSSTMDPQEGTPATEQVESKESKPAKKQRVQKEIKEDHQITRRSSRNGRGDAEPLIALL